ncbi:signal recognition particle protein, partial [Amnibacterium sp.]|uniref:signal recognition particle protein n=1 Tax=Amnibacterium sp. TaxID=1872496 RepID=UPI002612DC2F
MATFGTLSDRLTQALANLRGKGVLTASDVDGTVREIRRALLDADVNLDVVKAFTGTVRERALGAAQNKALNPAQQVVQIVNEELVGILGGEQRRLQFAKQPPTVIMLAGLQGAGKTTLAGKLAKWLETDGHTPLLVAADLQRPNAVQQLQVVGEQAGATVFAPEPGNGVGDPVKVAKDAMRFARDKQYDVVVIDTAGRLGVDAELMKQAANIRKATDPDEVLFVIDAMIGQDAVTTAKAFQEGVDFTGVVLTKLDGDARGGAALSVRSITGRPIMFASTGEKLTDFDAFHPDRMAGRILDMGDMLTLIEQAEKAFDSEQAAKDAEKLMGGSFTLDDFLKQMEAISKMGSMSKIVGMLPGMGQFKEQIENFDDREVDKIKAIILSMTPAERNNPKMIDGSRRARISKGS